MVKDTGLDLATLGRRIRHARQARNLTLNTVAKRVNRAPSLLSQVENGKREPRLALLSDLAEVLDVSVAYLMKDEAPSERAALELAVEQAQGSPVFLQLGLPQVRVGPRLPTDALRVISGLFTELEQRSSLQAATPEEARRANADLRVDMGLNHNYFPEIEKLAARISDAIGHQGGPLVRQGTTEIARYLGYEVELVADMPRAARSICDLKNRKIFLPVESRGDKDPRMVALRALGHLALGHQVPVSFADFLRQRVEANYFAGALLMPQAPTVALLHEAKAERNLDVSDLRDTYAVRYETAAHRFTNLATEHLDLTCHFSRVSEDGLIYKAYSNDGLEFPQDSSGAIEGQMACRYWGARQIFQSDDRFGVHYQFTDAPAGTFWCATRVVQTSAGEFAINMGVPFEHSRWFRGRDAKARTSSGCPDQSCCKTPPEDLVSRWAGYAWPSVRAHSHLLAAIPPGAFPGVDQTEVFGFLDRHSPSSG